MKQVAVLLAVFAIAIGILGVGVSYYLNQFNTENLALKAERDELLSRVEAREAQIEKLMGEVRDVEEDLISAKEAKAALEASGTDMSALLGSLAEGLGDAGEAGADAEADKKKSGMGAYMRNFQDQIKNDEGMRHNIAKMSVQQTYNAFFGLAGLSREKSDAVRDILIAHQESQLLSAKPEGMQFGKDIGGDQESRQTLSAALGEVLNTEELAVFEEYQDNLLGHVLGQQYETQLRMQVNGLDEDTLLYARDIIVDEMVAHTESMSVGAADASDDSTAMRRYFEGQLEAMTRAQARLAGELDEETMQRLESFFESQRGIAEMVAPMMEEMSAETTE